MYHSFKGRRSIRLKAYDYTQPGSYFVTICIQNRMCLLGNIQNGSMILNRAGMMVNSWWMQIPKKFPRVTTDAWVVMPNHCHGILVIGDRANDTSGHVNDTSDRTNDTGEHIGSPLPGDINTVGADPCVCPGRVSDPRVCPEPSLGRIVQWFKTMTTNAYIRGVKQEQWVPFEKRLWQRNYYDHIIRTDQRLRQIQHYVATNPQRWGNDQLHPQTPSKW